MNFLQKINFNSLNLFFFLSFLLLIFLIPARPYVWESYSDSYDYLTQSHLSLTSAEFYAPHKKDGFYPRSFTIPLFYKLASSDPDTIINLQKIIYAFSIFFIVFAVSQFFRKKSIKFAFLFAAYLFFSWWNILGWSIALLSECISSSLLFIWLATLLLLMQKQNLTRFIGHIVVAILLVFSRDPWSFLLVAFYGLLILVSLLHKRILLPKLLIMFSLAIVLFLVQQSFVKRGQRTKLGLTNTIVMRIVPNSEYFAWFVNEGLPCKDSLQQKFSKINYYDIPSRILVYDLYKSKNYDAFYNWINEKGAKTYAKFMLTHPAYTLLFKESKENRKRIFASNIGYVGDPRGIGKIVHWLFPFFNLWIVIVLIFGVLYFSKNEKDLFKWLPLILLIFLFFNVLLSYNADAFEVERHLFISQILIEFIGILATCMILDRADFGQFFQTLADKLKPKKEVSE